MLQAFLKEHQSKRDNDFEEDLHCFEGRASQEAQKVSPQHALDLIVIFIKLFFLLCISWRLYILQKSYLDLLKIFSKVLRLMLYNLTLYLVLLSTSSKR